VSFEREATIIPFPFLAARHAGPHCENDHLCHLFELCSFLEYKRHATTAQADLLSLYFGLRLRRVRTCEALEWVERFRPSTGDALIALRQSLLDLNETLHNVQEHNLKAPEGLTRDLQNSVVQLKLVLSPFTLAGAL
jgi:hypothetical protein